MTLHSATEHLDLDHELIAGILANRPRCLLSPGDERSTCALGSRCKTAIRKTLTELMVMSIAHFDREQEALRGAVHRADYEKHGSEHVTLTETLTDVLAKYTDTGDCLDAIAGLDRFTEAIRNHILTTDAPMLRTRALAD